jgi:hypothetical protein
MLCPSAVLFSTVDPEGEGMTKQQLSKMLGATWSDLRWMSSCSLNVSSLFCVLLQEGEDQCDASTTEMEVQVPNETEGSDSETLTEMEPSNTE